MGLSFSGMLDIAISLIFLYLLISLICTSICESIATLLKLRGRSLSVGVAKILESQSLIDRFYANGLVKGVVSASQWKTTAVEGVPTKYGHSSYIDSRSFAMALLGSIDPNKPFPGVQDIKDSLQTANLPSGIKDVLSAALTTGANDITAVRDEVASWFDSAMDRLSGEYKRQLKWISFSVGLFIAVLLNVDSVAIATRLWDDQALRQQIGNAAEGYLKQGSGTCPDHGQNSTKGNQAASSSAQVPSGRSSENVGEEVITALNCQLRIIDDAFSAARPFPLGWSVGSIADGSKDVSRHFSAIISDMPLMLSKIVGWLFTAVALSLGAPFWFDTLSKFMNVRGAGKKPLEVNRDGSGG